MTRPALLLLLVLSGATGCQAADAVGSPAPKLVSVDVEADCVQLTNRLLERDLGVVAAGRSAGPDVEGMLAEQYGADSPLVQKVERLRFELLLTATGDLLGRYGRDVTAELKAYQPRVLVGCAA